MVSHTSPFLPSTSSVFQFLSFLLSAHSHLFPFCSSSFTLLALLPTAVRTIAVFVSFSLRFVFVLVFVFFLFVFFTLLSPSVS